MSYPSLSNDLLQLIPDETLIEVASWLPTAKDLANFGSACKRTRTVLQEDPVAASTILGSRGGSLPIQSLEQLHWFEHVESSGILKENRLGLAADAKEVDCGEEDRLLSIQQILNAFPNCKVIIDTHCGTGVPLDISFQLSRVQGISLVHQLIRGGGIPDKKQLRLRAWGRQIAEKASASNHPHGELARCGLGWSEVYFEFDNLVLPPRPEYYP
eukprot:Nitzschia sp. Nitz4//scaffold285_size24199//16389//17030//NITZ4_008425-RA/size24199-processed-gene-0.6-mRNA-1//1//CDS//3329545716//1635//frame0